MKRRRGDRIRRIRPVVLYPVLWCRYCGEDRPVDILGDGAYRCRDCHALTDFTDVMLDEPC